MTNNIVSTGRKIALDAIDKFARENGYSLSDCPSREIAKDGVVSIIHTAPDGKEFGMGYRYITWPHTAQIKALPIGLQRRG